MRLGIRVHFVTPMPGFAPTIAGLCQFCRSCSARLCFTGRKLGSTSTVNMDYLKNLLPAAALLVGGHVDAQFVGSRVVEPRATYEESVRSDTVQGDARSWSLIVAPYVYHWEHSPDHRDAFALALEYQDSVVDDTLVGFSLFRNSFGQPSAYAYWGKRWNNLWGNPDLTLKLTGGVLYGYVGQFKDRVPLNYNGFSPCIVPVLLYHLDQDRTLDVMVLGVGGLGFSYTHKF